MLAELIVYRIAVGSVCPPTVRFGARKHEVPVKSIYDDHAYRIGPEIGTQYVMLIAVHCSTPFAATKYKGSQEPLQASLCNLSVIERSFRIKDRLDVFFIGSIPIPTDTVSLGGTVG